MFVPAIKRFIIIILFSASALFAKAQQIHFIYLQTENGQPFYVKLNNKVVSSSSAGYLILPKLIDGDYQLSIGFPRKEFPEENFQISVANKNEGFLLKNFGEKGWGLFNMQSFDVVMGNNTNTAEPVAKNLQNDPFSKMLANVVKDSSILQKNEPVKEVPVVAKVDSTVAVAEKKEPPLFSPATKFLSKKNNDGMEMIYIDTNQSRNDTIRIFIPAEKPIIKTNVDTEVVQNEKPSPSFKDTALVNVANAVKKANADTDTSTTPAPVFLENINSIKNKDSAVTEKTNEVKHDEVKQPELNGQDSVMRTENKPDDTQKDNIVVLPKVVKSSTINSDCKAFAADEDFLKLRKKMASENSDDNMIKIAKKVFHSKCFSTEQIKNLSFLFLTNEGKYRFFDLAYAFASDSDQYYTLQSQLTDNYYINRFKAMIHK